MKDILKRAKAILASATATSAEEELAHFVAKMEITDGTYSEGLMDKAFALVGKHGEEEHAKYIELRAKQLLRDSYDALQDIKTIWIKRVNELEAIEFNQPIKETQGDLIHLAREGQFDVIVHGCNCFCTMGAGLAKRIKDEFPDAYLADQNTLKGDKEKLGGCSVASIGDLFIVNAYIQYHYRGKGVKVNYDATRSCMKWIKKKFSGSRIGLPKIGAGLAGGDWDTIFGIIQEELSGEDATIVEYSSQSRNA